MARIRSSRTNFSVGGTALEGRITSLTQELTQPEIDITCLGDDGPASLIDNYRYGYNLDGVNDYAAGSLDATLWGMVGDEDGAATVFSPTGNSAGADDPNYEGQAVLSQYTITCRVGQANTYSARLGGAATLDRAVA